MADCPHVSHGKITHCEVELERRERIPVSPPSGLKTTRVVEQPSGVMRDTDEGKPQPILVRDGPMFMRWVRHLTAGVSARGKRNWMKADSPEDLERFRESAARHFEQWLAGEEDEDHAAAVFFNMNGTEYVKARLAQIRPSPLLHFSD